MSAREKIAKIITETLEFDGVVHNKDETADAILSNLPDIVREMKLDIVIETLNAAHVHTKDRYGMEFLAHPFERDQIIKSMGLGE